MHSYLLPGQISILFSVTRPTCHAYLPVTRPNIHSCLCYQGQRSCILTSYQVQYLCLSLLLGQEVKHTYLLPGPMSMLISVTRARDHQSIKSKSFISLNQYDAKLPDTRPETLLISKQARGHSKLLPCHRTVLITLQARGNSELFLGQEVIYSNLLPGQRIMLISSQAKGHSELLLGPEILHSYLLPGQKTIFISCQVRGHP
jgi:hypothetical protein